MFNFLFQGKVGEMMAPIKSPEAQLLIAIQNRQADKIRELLEVQGVSANSANDRGVRPMHMACQGGDMALVQRLLELGADITTADKAGNTPLHYASKGGRVEMVKMLVGQGVGVEKRNAARLTSYDVATDHVIRQFLLPLQLRAEAGNPEYAVHGMGITSDAPRNYEQYGVPGMSQPSHGQPYGQHQHQHHDPSSGGADNMNAALGALMQAPSMVPPRPAQAPMGAAPPTINTAGFVGAPSGQPGSFSPSVGGGPGGYPVASAASPAASTSPPPPAVASPPLPTPGSLTPPFPRAGTSNASPATSSPPPFGLPPAALTSNGVEERKGATPTSAGGDAPPTSPAGSKSLSSPLGVAGRALPGAAVQTVQGAGGAYGTGASPVVSPRAAGGVGSSAIDAGVAGLFTSEAESSAATPEVVVGAGGGGQASSPHPGGVGGNMFSSVPVHVKRQEEGDTAVAGAMTPPRQHAGSVSAETSVPSGDMVSVDLSSRFQVQAAISGGPEVASNANIVGATPPPPTHPSSAPSSDQGRTAPAASRPQGAYTPGPGPHQPPGEVPRKFKLIKPDGFHSSASDKELQARYGHTKIVRDMGAPPTAAQLGGPLGPPPGASYGGAPPMPGPPSMAEPPRYGGGYAQPPTQYARPSGHYGQPFGGGGVQNFSPQPFGQAPQHPQVHHSPPPPHQGHGGQAFAPPLVNVNNGVGGNTALPMPGGYAHPSARGSVPPPAGFPPADGAFGNGGRGARGGGYSVFNPSTDRVVAADSTSNAVL